MLVLKQHGNAKLTEVEILNIRLLFATGAKQRELAQRFGIRQSTISKIVHEHERHCIDCQIAILSSRKRCDTCKKAWQSQYFQQWYEDTGRRGHQRRNRKRVQS